MYVCIMYACMMYVCIYVLRIYGWMYICMYDVCMMYVCMYVCMHACMYVCMYLCTYRSQWPRGLRLRSAAAHLLRLWIPVPPGAWISVVSVVCCRVEGSASS